MMVYYYANDYLFTLMIICLRYPFYTALIYVLHPNDLYENRGSRSYINIIVVNDLLIDI